MSSAIVIRRAVPEDAPALLDIFRPYVLETAINFSFQPPTEEEFRENIRCHLRRYPYLVAQRDGVPIGYAYASPFKSQSAYDWAVETSIYVRRGLTHSGCGRRLHDALERILKAQHILSMYACIAYTDHPDEYLTNNSADFHAHMGYRLTATFPQCGYKFGRWYDMIWMHREIGPHTAHPLPVLPVTEIDTAALLQE